MNFRYSVNFIYFLNTVYLINGPHADIDKLLIGVVVTCLHFSCLDNALIVLILS